MTKEEIDKNIETFQIDHLKWMKNKMLKDGTIGPMITIFALKKETDTMGIIFAPIIGEFKDDDKEQLVKKVLPHLFQQIKEDGMVPYCFSFASEVFVRKVNLQDLKPGEDFIPKDWQSLDKTEALMITFETRGVQKTHLYNMEKIGQSINEEGEIVSQIELSDMDMGITGNTGTALGKFANLFKEYGEE